MRTNWLHDIANIGVLLSMYTQLYLAQIQTRLPSVVIELESAVEQDR